jgi:hypothetical protein
MTPPLALQGECEACVEGGDFEGRNRLVVDPLQLARRLRDKQQSQFIRQEQSGCIVLNRISKRLTGKNSSGEVYKRGNTVQNESIE